MTDTSKRIMEMAEFDLDEAYLRAKNHLGLHGDLQFVKGTISEHKKLMPIITALIEDREKLIEALETTKKHCVCTRNVKGFDYGEKHAILGKADPGKRWLVPYDIADQAIQASEKRMGSLG